MFLIFSLKCLGLEYVGLSLEHHGCSLEIHRSLLGLEFPDLCHGLACGLVVVNLDLVLKFCPRTWRI